MVGSIDQRGLRFHRAMLGFCAALFGYMLGALTVTVQLGNDYSVPQWIVVGSLVFASAVLLTYQVGKVRRIGDRGVQRSRRGAVAPDAQGNRGDGRAGQ